MTTETAKTVRLDNSMWEAISDVRFSHRFKSEADAIREIIAAGLKSLKVKKKGTNS